MTNAGLFGFGIKLGTPGMRHVLVGAFVVLLTVLSAVSRAADGRLTDEDCGDVFKNATGPFDYNDPEARDGLDIVERFHFTPDVEGLVRGSTGYLIGDLDYTLRAIPNHHRALNAVARYDLEKGGIPANLRSATCYFQRATVFRPDDGMVWLIYGNYQVRKKLYEEALESYERSKKLMPGSVEVDYNLGLLYFKMGDYEKSLAYARVAYAGNYPLQGLRHQLDAKGYSVELPTRP